MSFTTPLALLLLLALPLAAWLVWPRRPGGRPLSGWLGLVLRLLIMALIVLSLAGAQLVRAVDDLAVIFLIDASDSMGPENIAAAEEFVGEALAEMGPDDRAGIIIFGANALVEQPLRPFDSAGDLPPFASQPARIATDLAEAIRLSLAILPPNAARRLVILSDGAATVDGSAEAARLAAASGVTIDTIYMPRPPATGEIILRDVRAPARVNQGEVFRLEVSAESATAADAILRVLGDGVVIYEEPVRLQPGANNFVVRLRADEPAFTRYRVQLAPSGGADTYPQNNELAAFTEVVGQPRVLVVAAGSSDSTTQGVQEGGDPLPDEAAQLVDALTASGLPVDRVTPATLSPGLADLADYAAIVLVNVNARDLSPRKMETLQAYTRDLGGGLVVVGGPESYGVGGYFGTPLEETLPVTMQIDDQERFPAVSMALVIDRSGSMSAVEGGVTKIQLAAEGAVRALDLLNDFDEMTIIPVDEAPDEIIGPVTADNREEAIDRLRRMGAGGGGIYVRTGLEAAAEALANGENAGAPDVRHIIVLADGADAEQKEGVPELIEQLAAEGITVSMVSIGAGPDTEWLREMAELGGGRFHFTDQAANLPQIFTQETIAIQRNYVIEERFFPTQVAQHPILTGIVATPPLYGYVATSARLIAQTPLETHLGDPLLATWQYGLGRSVAWTSDATSRWAIDWVRWDEFATFWNQAVRWSFGSRPAGGLDATVQFDGEMARLIVDAQVDGQYLSDLNLTANVIDPAGKTQTVELRPVAPGRYEASFAPAVDGAYFIGVGTTGDGGDCDPASVGCGLQTAAGWVLGYSPEYASLAANPALLASLAEIANGRSLTQDEGASAAIFDHNLAAAPARQPIWPWLALAATLLLPLDIAARRLTLTRRDWATAWQKIRSLDFGIKDKENGLEPERPPGMAQLLRAKEKIRKEESNTRMEQKPDDTRATATGEGRQTVIDQTATAGEQSATSEQSPAAGTPASETLAARLRKRREG